MAHGYPPRRPPAGAGGGRYPDGPGGRHGYPDQPDDDRGYPEQPDAEYSGDPSGGGYPDDVPGGYPDEPGGGGYPDDPRGGGYPDDGRGGDPGYPDDQRGGYPDDQGGGYPDQQGGGYPDQQGGGGYSERRGRHGYSDEEPGPVYPDDRQGYRGHPDAAGGGHPGDRRHPGDRGRPGRPGRIPTRPPRIAPGRGRQTADAFDDDEDVMPWTGPGIYPVGPGRRELRPPPAEVLDSEPDVADEESAELEDYQDPGDGQEPERDQPADRGRGRRAAAARARKSRRRLILGGGVLVVAAVIVLAVLGLLPFQGRPSTSSNNGLVTSFQRGEFRSVPDACHSVSAATLSTYLPGKVAQVSQTLGSATQSQCTWTLDSHPNFRVLTVTSQAFAPSLLTSGNGSATAGAIDAYKQQLQGLRNPPKASSQPKAQIGGAVGLGSTAFTALQVFHTGGDVSDEVTVVARDHNVVIIVTMQGQESGGGFGPVPDATLRAGALAAAHQALAALH